LQGRNTDGPYKCRARPLAWALDHRRLWRWTRKPKRRPDPQAGFCRVWVSERLHLRTSAGSSRGRTILSWRRVCGYWAARLYGALARELRARCGRFRGSGCRARFAAARARLRGCGLFRVRDRWGIGKACGLLGCVDADRAACSRAGRAVKPGTPCTNV
jgi:hypothetical protein